MATASGARLEGRVAVVTGGASGIGRAIAEAYLANGASVVLGDRNADLLDTAVEELGERCAGVAGDVTVEDDVERLVATAVDAFGGLDLGVNCAGFATLAPVVDHELAAWSDVIATCLTGVFLAVKHEARAMARQGRGGGIINIASINARQPAEGMAAYCSAKAAVEMLTKVAAMELGPSGIRVAGIGPGLIDTPLTAYQRDLPAFRQAYLDNTPLGRVGTTADVAAAALFLASDDASWVTGETLFVDGGALTRSYPRMLGLLGGLADA
jgi:NAD(P)-dependent dehydrogenase (short-subunit alcohol dehydrogenase family)